MSVNSPWNQSFMSLLMGDQQIPPPPADPDLSSPATTLDLGVKSQSQSTRSDLWCSQEEEANYLASLGLSLTSSEDSSATSKGTTVEVDSWSVMEDQMLRAAMADTRVMEHPVIPWQRIAEALPWRTPLEVFNRTNQMLQTIQRDLCTMMSQQQQQEQEQKQKQIIVIKEKQQQQEIRQVRKRWSEEEDDKFRVGIERYGWGNWKMVANLIPGRTVPQVTSHAQMYIKKNSNQSPIPKRRRINY